MCSVIVRGQLPQAISRLLSTSRLIALPKKNGDIRPIAIGEVFRRITAKAICTQLRSDFRDHFSPIQHGVAVEGGAELLVHHAQLALELNTSWALLKTDMSNAFNSVSRSQLLHQVETSFPELLPHVRQMYAEASDLVYQMESETVLITSEGVHQGDPLGPSLFSLAIHPIVSQLQKDHHNVRILAYLDDIFILGEPDNAIDAGLALKHPCLILACPYVMESVNYLCPTLWSSSCALSQCQILGQQF